jgi:hypothetical protein
MFDVLHNLGWVCLRICLNQQIATTISRIGLKASPGEPEYNQPAL